jgi:hypothetical protein
MAVEISRVGWLQAYIQMRAPNGFLSRFFTVKPGGIYRGKKVQFDIQRFGEEVAVVVTKCTGPNLNDFDEFTTKEMVPPSYGEAFALDVCELLDRMVGVDPYSAQGIEYGAQLAAAMAKGFMLVDDKIKRAVEQQASQILQTGVLSLKDKEGNIVYTIDFKPKATHFPTVGTSWSAAGADPLADMQALAKVIRGDGKINVNIAIMGDVALNNFLSNDDVQTKLDTKNFELGNIAPFFEDSGATFYGFVWVGAYRFAIATYPDTFTDPETGLPVEYVAPDKVIMLSDRTRLDMTSAVVPLPLGPDPRVAGLLPGRLSSAENGFDVTPNVYPTPNGKQVMGELESRPLLIPVQIDGFGCLDTEI